MWSGGIDSSYLLAKELKETDDTIFSHHIHFVNQEKRHDSELQAIINLIPLLRKIREFHYTDSAVRLPGLPFDMAVVNFIAGLEMRRLRLEKGIIIDWWGIGTCLEEGHDEIRFQVLLGGNKAAYWTRLPDVQIPPPFKLHDLVTKRAEMEYLKQLGMLESCWYCRTPTINGKVCKKCKTCEEVAKACRSS